MRRFPVYCWAACLLGLLAPLPARAQITLTGPFSGTVLEQFTVPLPDPFYTQYTIFGGLGLVKNIHPQGSLKIEYSSTRGGDTVLPYSAPTFGGQIGISEWTFPNPLSSFGGYWENNSRFNDGNISFYDVNDMLLGSLPMNIPRDLQAWTWNGWTFGTPVKRMVIAGNDTVFFSGFIWYDDVTATFATIAVPEVSSVVMLSSMAIAFAGFMLWRWKHGEQCKDEAATVGWV